MSQIRTNSIVPAGGVVAGAAGGGIIQVVTNTYTSATTHGVSANSWTNLSALNTTITPRSTSSKILIHLGFNGTCPNTAFVRLKRGTTAIATGASGAGAQSTLGSFFRNSDGNHGHSFAVSYVDSPGTTSATTYGVDMSADNNSTVYVNRALNNSTGWIAYRAVSTITLMEISN